jgi:hypothetical protein
MRLFWALAGFVLYGSLPVFAQQPFITDDTDVTPRRIFHVELSNQFDRLQRTSFPNLRQNIAEFELDYGLFEGIEIGIAAPVITIIRAPATSPRRVFGPGDTSLLVKYNFHREREGSWLPALTVNLSVELPTGDIDRQLGSGQIDVWLNGIAQKSLSNKTTLRLNGGIFFVGDLAAGAIGLRTRGRVLTGGASVVREFTPKLQLGAEVTGARSPQFNLSRGQLQMMIGGNYALKSGLSIDFGLIAGFRPASPRYGAQIGISFDF